MAYGAILGQTSKEEVPIGGIIIWSGAENMIPNNWHLCDGTNGTPDLRNRFVVGAGDNYEVEESGGNDNIVLQISNLPSHNHSASLNLSGLTTNSAGEHTHAVYTYQTTRMVSSDQILGSYSYGLGTTNIPSSGAHTHTISGSGTVSINNTGSGEAFDNMPPYYALCYIMKIA